MRRLAWLLAAGSLFGVWGWLWWNATRNSEGSFLPNHVGGEWIVYPSAPDLVWRRRTEMSASFRRSFVLDQTAPEAALLVAGFHRYNFSLNGLAPPAPVQRGNNWKQPDRYEVARALRPGTNEIVVAVTNTNGPPALWLSLVAGGFRLSSDERWTVSYAGAVWRNARLAAKPRVMSAGSALLGGARPWASVRARWPVLLLFAALSAVLAWALGRWCAAGARSAEGKRAWLRELLPVAGLAGLWAALFANNLAALTPPYGFDADAHTAYVSYIQQHKALPLANEGWEMFQPPLYYLLSAALLGVLRLSASQPAGVMALRVMGLGIGLGQIVLVWATLRLLFRGGRAKQLWGLVLAACLPPLLYLSQYVTNEVLAAATVSACLYLALRAVQPERPSWKLDAGLGLCLGAALLTKSTALIFLPVLFGALLWRRLEKRDTTLGQWIGRLSLIFGLCLLVAGGHYARWWAHFGNPLIGVWDPKLGFSWWQDDGWRTSAFYLRFGQALAYPWYGSVQSFAGGNYSTLWGDGLLSGVSGFASAPPWNYELMAAGYGLALLPSLGVLTGGILMARRFMREPTAEWFLMLALGLAATLAMVYLSLAMPYSCHVKAFYGLSALAPFCACGALGLDFLARRSGRLRPIVCVLFGVWAINSYASFWIVRSSVRAVVARSQCLFQAGRYAEAAQVLQARLESEPPSAPLRQLLVSVLAAAGQSREALRQAEILVRDHPDDAQAHLAMVEVLAPQRQTDEALRHARRALALAPGSRPAYEYLAKLLETEGRHEESLAAAREGLGIAPFNAELRLVYGADLLRGGAEAEAEAQFQLALGLQPDNVPAHCQLASVLEERQQTAQAVVHYQEALRLQPECREALNNLAWIRAANPQAELRNGAEAVALAERACRLTEHQEPNLLSTLAAAYAEAGRFDEAVGTAARAQALAKAGGQQALAEQIQELRARFSARQPYREATGRAQGK
jgi:Flp pilus assembly protein TadD